MENAQAKFSRAPGHRLVVAGAILLALIVIAAVAVIL
jgi:hypothetical protein